MKSLTKLLAVIFAALFLNNIANAACGKITYANMNWASASLMANIDKIILSTLAINEAEAQFMFAYVIFPHAAFAILFKNKAANITASSLVNDFI